MVLYGELRAHDVLFDLTTEILQSPVLVEFDFKLDLLGRWILGIGAARVLIVWRHLLEVLVLNLHRHEQLDALMVLVFVARHEGWLLGGRVGRAARLLGGWLGRPVVCLAVWVGPTCCLILLLEVLVIAAAIVVFQIEALCGPVLLGYLPLLVHVCEVARQLSLQK